MSTVDDIRWGDMDDELWRLQGTSGPGWPAAGRNPADLRRLLEIHGDDGSGYCRAVCQYQNHYIRGVQYAYKTCPTWRWADAELRKLVAERSNGANGY